MRVLGIETSCDETGVAVLEGMEVRSSVLASQVELHERFGGVVPEVAARAHVEAIRPLAHRAITQAGIHPDDLDAIVIGSGIVVLAVAALLAIHDSRRVVVLERHTTAGGFTHTFDRKGWEWDVGVHYIGQVHHEGSMLLWVTVMALAGALIAAVERRLPEKTMQATRSWQLRVPDNTLNLIVDSPASISHDDLRELTRDSSSILVPVLPSALDIDAASKCIADLLLVAKVNRNEGKLAVIANRTRKHTKSFGRLMRFLDSLGIPIIAVMRDSQNFVHAAEQGMGLCEMPPSRVRADVDEIRKIKQWLDAWPERRRDTGNATSIKQKSSLGRSLLRRAQFGSA